MAPCFDSRGPSGREGRLGTQDAALAEAVRPPVALVVFGLVMCDQQDHSEEQAFVLERLSSLSSEGMWLGASRGEPSQGHLDLGQNGHYLMGVLTRTGGESGGFCSPCTQDKNLPRSPQQRSAIASSPFGVVLYFVVSMQLFQWFRRVSQMSDFNVRPGVRCLL